MRECEREFMTSIRCSDMFTVFWISSLLQKTIKVTEMFLLDYLNLNFWRLNDRRFMKSLWLYFPWTGIPESTTSKQINCWLALSSTRFYLLTVVKVQVLHLAERLALNIEESCYKNQTCWTTLGRFLFRIRRMIGCKHAEIAISHSNDIIQDLCWFALCSLV